MIKKVTSLLRFLPTLVISIILASCTDFNFSNVPSKKLMSQPLTDNRVISPPILPNRALVYFLYLYNTRGGYDNNAPPSTDFSLRSKNDTIRLHRLKGNQVVSAYYIKPGSYQLKSCIVGSMTKYTPTESCIKHYPTHCQQLAIRLKPGRAYYFAQIYNRRMDVNEYKAKWVRVKLVELSKSAGQRNLQSFLRMRYMWGRSKIPKIISKPGWLNTNKHQKLQKSTWSCVNKY